MTRKYIFINTPSLKIELAQRELENDSWNNERRKRNVTLTWNPPWLAMFEGTKNPSPSVNRAWTPLCHPLPLPCSTLWPPVPSKLRIHAVSRDITPPIVMYVKGWPSCRKRREGREGDLRLETTPELTCCSTSPLFGPPYLIIPSYHLPFTSVSVIAPCARRPCAYYRWNVDGNVWVTADRPFRGNFIRIMDTFTTRWNQKSQSSNRESILVVAADYKILILREIIYNKYVASKKKYDI